MEIHVLILHTSPKALNKHVVHPASLAAHADSNPSTLEHLQPRLAGKLRTLVCVEDLRRWDLSARPVRATLSSREYGSGLNSPLPCDPRCRAVL
jgi:hypothetical protein